MKHTNKFLGTMLLAAAVLTSCADMDPLEYAFEKPASIEGMEYLADYDALKEYKSENSKVSPDFKLGMALAATDYNANGMWTRLANANFDEIVAGNEMKMASIVNDKGDMDFGTVETFLMNAEENGMNVYGHTLAWHSQQPVKWLKSLIADKEIPIDPDAANNFLKITVPKAGDVSYSWQIYYVLPTPLVKGKTYHLSMRAKAKNSFKMGFWPYKDGGATQYLADPAVPLEWGTLTWDFTASDDHTQLQWAIGFLESELCFDDIVLVEDGSEENLVENGNFDQESTTGWRKNGWHGDLQFGIGKEGAGPAVWYEDLIDNGDMEGDDAHNFWVKENSGSTINRINNGVGVDGSRGAKIESVGGQKDAWESQFWIESNKEINEGDKVHIEFDYRADGGCAGTSVQIQTHMGPGDYIDWNSGLPNVEFKEGWNHYKKDVTLAGSACRNGVMKSFAFNMSPNGTDGNYYIDNVVLQIEKSGSSIPLTPEEKKEVLTGAMDKWVSGMMEACAGRVKAWDVVNEAISGGDPDSEGVYALQHDPDGTKPSDFYWQDYLGDIDYVRTVVAKAREYGPEDLKLFVNDYNLESDWDNNAKLKSLVAWIKRWEADGVTKIDGIGTQMHLTYQSNPDIQASKEKHIAEMFKLLAASGKLVRVSELDIAFADEQGNNIAVENMTDAQLRKVAAFYKWLITQYVTIIPAAQQYGFCIWTAIDAAPDVSWTHQQLYGLWDKNYNRTHAYAGFADGLAGK